ncbi:hypothetical protein MLD38_011051 [Melastoma candidum]|uniref:Uncharacterized protein n=1 Tax=Melastoma candidum TaxID=119954 RepID=A0ACB9R1G8_9MYRT|nr:hypothetical protein MLD38_011051 [Melastoma candidum]
MIGNSNNWSPHPPLQGGGVGGGGEAPVSEAVDWRGQFSPGSRKKIVNKIMETLKKHLPVSGPGGLNELKKIAVMFEERTYQVAANQPDYLKRISLKMLTMEAKSQNTIPNATTSNSNISISKPSDNGILPQMSNTGQQLSNPLATNQSQPHQQLLVQDIQNNAPSGWDQTSGNLSSKLLPVSGLNQSSLPAVVRQNTNTACSQNSLGNTTGQDQPPLQQSQLNSQQNTMGDSMQQPQQQLQSRLPSQQSNLPNLWQQQLLSHQNNLSNVHQQPLVTGLHQQQQLLGSNALQVGQHAVRLLEQSKPQVPPQIQSGGTNLVSQGQQLQPMAVQQQLNSRMQQSPAQLQSQHRSQSPNSLLQQQNAIDQQKQLYQSERTLSDAPSILVGSTGQARKGNAGDWREEAYQKLQVMKGSYLLDLTEMNQKIGLKLQQHDSLPQQPKPEQLDKMKQFKTMLEQVITILQMPKSDISITLKENMGLYEKQILNFLNMHRPRKPAALRPGQPRAHQMVQPQQSQPQIAQMQSHGNQINPQSHDSLVTMQQSNIANSQHNSLSSTSGVSGAQQSIMNSLQSNSGIESGRGKAVGSITQVAMQNSLSVPQQVSKSTMSHRSGVSMLESSVNGIQPNSDMVEHQHLKQQPEQLIIQMHQDKHQIQQRQLQQWHMQQQQQQEAKQIQQQLLPAQLMAHQKVSLHQMSDGNDRKMRPGLGVHPVNQCMNYPHQQWKPGSLFPLSSPHLLQAVSQIPSLSSPQIDQQNILSSLAKAGTPLQSANSPFLVPSPSTPLAPSPMLGDLEKPISAVSSLLSVGNFGHQASLATSHAAPSLAIGTPGISASPLLADFSCTDGAHGNATAAISSKSTATDQPIERLMTAVKALSAQALSAGVNDIGSVVIMVDRITGSAPGYGSRAAVGQDLVAISKCRLEAKNFQAQDGAPGIRKMKRFTSAMPLSIASSTGSVEDEFLQFAGMESSELDSTATSAVKRPRTETNHILLEEIRYINQRLIDTVIDISEEDVDPSSAAAAVAEGGGVIVKCSYNAVSLSPDLKSHYESGQMSRIQPLCLLVPANYPDCSPLLLDKFPLEVSEEYEDLYAKTKSRFSISLRNLSQPMSLKEIARTWDKCARGVILEYAQQLGGGSFSSKYGNWESCLTA